MIKRSWQLEFHPIAEIFPLLNGAEYAALRDDIREHGVREPITLYEGKILDGRNRFRAAVEERKPFETWEFEGSPFEAVAFVWSENFLRRHLNSSQAAIAEMRREKLDAEYAAEVEKMRRSQPKGGRPRIFSKGPKPHQIIGEVKAHERQTEDRRAKAAGTNRTYLALADRIVDEFPEKAEAIERGEKTIPQVQREITREETLKKVAELPSQKYRVLYADPPWKYGNRGSGLDKYGPAERHYPTMTITELCALDVGSIVTDDAVLFLWVPSPILSECWPVIRAWGFRYKACFVWDKIRHNYGHYNSVRHELLLICTRGSCTPECSKLFDSVVSIERTKHSAKPEKFREMIDTLYPHGKRIELFARKKVKGWSSYGNQL